jgi:NAD-dependent dihydropyrimidine dehydrogenase PreA subunit
LALVDKISTLVRPEECTECSVCYWLCPHDAITMVDQGDPVFDRLRQAG